MGLSRSLREARDVAGQLKADLKSLKQAHIREEYEKLVQRSHVLLSSIEECHHRAPEAAAHALQKLQQAQGRMARAIREEQQKSSWAPRLSGLGLNRSISHPESFLEATRLVTQALDDLRASSTGSSSGGLSEQQQQSLRLQQQLQQELDEAPDQTGLLTRYLSAVGPLSYNHIAAINLQPGPVGSIGNLWVFLHSPLTVQLDIYAACNVKHLKTKSMSSSMKVTCMMYDDFTGVTWTGHADGSVRVHRMLHPSTAEAATPQCSIATKHCHEGVAVRSLAVERHSDPSRQPRCWVGDDDGRLCIMALQANPPQLLVKNTKTPDELRHTATTLSGALSLHHGLPSGPLLSTSLGPGTSSAAASSKGVPVLAMLCVGRSMVVSGGISQAQSHCSDTTYRLELWDCKQVEKVQQFACSSLGAATCLELLDGPVNVLSGALSAPTRQSSSGSEASMRSSVDEGDVRLLSGHTQGQVVLWRLQGRGTSAQLHELAIIGDPSNRPVKAVYAFPHWDMLVVAQSSGRLSGLSSGYQGKLSVSHLPTAAQLSAAARRREEAVTTPHKVAQKTVDLQVSATEAHSQPILATTRWGEVIVTASTSTLRAWSPKQLALEAQKDGLAFTRVAESGSSFSSTRQLPGSSPNSSLDTAPCMRVDSDPSPFVVQQQQQQQQQHARPMPMPPSPGQRTQGQQSWSPQAASQVEPVSPAAQVQTAHSPGPLGTAQQVSPTAVQQDARSRTLAVAAAVGAAAAGAAVTGLDAEGAPAAAAEDAHDSAFSFDRPRPSSKAAMLPPPQWPVPQQSAVAPEHLVKQAVLPDAQEQLILPAPGPPKAQAATCPADVEADLTAELAAQCGYQFIKQLSDQSMFGASRVLQVRSNHTNRLRTILQVPRAELQRLQQQDSWGFAQFKEQLVGASELHHPHTLQVQEVFLGPLHLNIVLEECSAGRLVDFPAQQHSMWAAGGGGGDGSSGAALSPEFARWFFQQVVLAVDYYHTKIGNSTGTGAADKPSLLSVKDALLKTVPNLPQPVVKVPTAVLARGVRAVALPASAAAASSSSGSGGGSGVDPDPFVPPEAFQSRFSGAARPDTPAGDVWACGVLLLTLLGGTVKKDVYSCPISKTPLPGSQLFELPAMLMQEAHTSTSSNKTPPAGGQVLIDLLASMLQPQVCHRSSLNGVKQHPWFKSALPPTASSMTQRFTARGRTCKQPQQETEAVVSAAAAAGPLTQLRGLQDLRRRHKQPRSAQQQQQHLGQPQLPAGPISPEMLYTLQLQLLGLRRACLCLSSTSTLSKLSASKLTELLITQQAVAYSSTAFMAMDRAVLSMQQLMRLQQAKMGLRKPAGDRFAGMALLLHSVCSTALYSVSKLLQLLQGLQQPSQWRDLQHNIPQVTSLKLTLDGKPSPDALRWRGWLMQLQVYLLVHAHQALYSLWCCSKVAAAVTAACMRPAQPLPAVPMPSILTAVAGGPAVWALAGADALLWQMLQCVLAGPDPATRQMQLGLCHAVLCQQVLQLVWLNDSMRRQLQQGPRCISRIRFDAALEDVDFVMVSTQAGQIWSPDSGCVAYEGRLLSQQQQQADGEVLVVALAPLGMPDVSQGLPAARISARERRQQEQDEVELRAKADTRNYLCPICRDIMKDPVFCEDGYTYDKDCIEKHILGQLQAGKSVISPLTNMSLVDTSLKPIYPLRSGISQFLEEEKARQRAAREQHQQQHQQLLLSWQQSVQGVQSAGASGAQELQLQQQQERDQGQGQEGAGTVVKACDHLLLAHAAGAYSVEAPRTLRQMLVVLQDAGLLSSGSSGQGGNDTSSSGGSTVADGSSVNGHVPLLAPIHGMCLDPPVLVLPKPPCGTLEQWIRTASSRAGGGVGDFTAAWVSGMSWTQVLQLLGDVAAALGLLHQQQPAVVHGGVHAAAINLLQQLSHHHHQQQQSVSGSGRVCQLSLAGVLSQLAPISSCHPFLAAPEVALAAGPATPAADVYGFGVLMFQLASGWLPQQYTPGTNEQISAVMWCREMMATAGTTSPLAAAACLQQQQSSGSVCEPAGPWTPYGRHMLSPDAQARLPAGYYGLMEACLQRVPPARPCAQELVAQVQCIAMG